MPKKFNPTSKVQGGSITLFLALTLTLVLSFCFSLLEAARVQSLSAMAGRRLLLDLESAFGEYHTALWQDYRLLFLDGSDGAGQLDLASLEGHMMGESDWAQKGSSFFQMVLRNMEVVRYGLATDGNGTAFELQACRAMKEQLVAGAVDAWKEKLGKGEELASKRQGMEKTWNQAKDAVEDAEVIEKQKEEAQAGEEGNVNVQPAKREGREQAAKGEAGILGKELPENPIESVDLLKRSVVLQAVVENPSVISGKTIVGFSPLEGRQKEKGNMEEMQKGSLDKICFLQYLNDFFSCYTGSGKKGSQEHALDYELEYCIAGKDTDAKNLEKVVKELLLLREVGNFATIMQDGKKQSLALEMATAAVGFTGIVPLIEAVKLGILLAWSYIESVLDVRSLLAGGKVPLMKKPSDWKSDVALGKEALKQEAKKTEEEDGWDYREYLLLLLALVREHTLVNRAMDVVEQNIRLQAGETNFRMDQQIYHIQAEGLYVAAPLFLGFVTAGKKVDGTYHFCCSQEFSYFGQQ